MNQSEVQDKRRGFSTWGRCGGIALLWAGTLAWGVVAGAAEDGASPTGVASQEPSRFPGIEASSLPLLEEIDQQNPRLIPAWLEVRRLQAEWDRNFAIFGKQARRDAEREMAVLERALDRAMKVFRSEYERIRKPWLAKEEGLRMKAAQLSEKKPESSEARQQARDEEVSRLYSEAMSFYERASALAQLDKAVTIEHPPGRLDQIGVTRGSPVLKSLSRAELDLLLPAHLSLRDALADIEALQARKTDDATSWRSSDDRQMATAERELERSLDLVRKAVAKLKKPHETSKAKLEKSLESVSQRIEKGRDRNRSTERLDAEAVELARQIEAATEALAAIDAFGDWSSIAAKWPEAGKQP